MDETAASGAPGTVDDGIEIVSSLGGDFEIANPLTRLRAGLWLVILGLIGLFASAGLAIEHYLVMANPEHVPACSLSIFITCSDAMESWQGSLFGFPNPFMGIAAFPVVITTGIVMMLGFRFPRWYWLSLLAALTVGMVFVVFLVASTIATIGKLCPYCLVIWAAMIVLFVQSIAYAFVERYLPAPAGLRRWFVTNRSIVIVALFVVLVGSIVLGMWDAVVEQLRAL